MRSAVSLAGLRETREEALDAGAPARGRSRQRWRRGLLEDRRVAGRQLKPGREHALHDRRDADDHPYGAELVERLGGLVADVRVVVVGGAQQRLDRARIA